MVRDNGGIMKEVYKNKPITACYSGQMLKRVQHDKRKVAFTLGEILIAIGIIGIVAALTVPLFVSKVNEKIYESGRKEILSIIGKAAKNLAANDDLAGAGSTENFIKTRLSKQMYITKICSGYPSNNFENCGFPSKFKYTESENSDVLKEKRTSTYLLSSYGNTFRMKNGYSVYMHYKSNCVDAATAGTYSKSNGFEYINFNNIACINALYDINGLKGPNQIGKDMGIVTVFNPGTDNITVAPMPTTTNGSSLTYYQAQDFCAQGGYVMPNYYEATSLDMNTYFTSRSGGYTWTSTPNPHLPEQNMIHRFGTNGGLSWWRSGKYGNAVCIKKNN